ncbi:hypothetical protein BHM03_00049258 [Ensete ventricosum]|nr:hypothetical protein BHM03_00049258 [Ensete ventricosum]
MWYSRLKPFSVSSFNLLAKEFEFNFLVSAKPKDKELLSHFVSRFVVEIRVVLLVVNRVALDVRPRNAPARNQYTTTEAPVGK